MNEPAPSCPEWLVWLFADCSQYTCTALSHNQMTIIWTQGNTRLVRRRQVLFSWEDGCSLILLAFHYNSLLSFHLLCAHWHTWCVAVNNKSSSAALSSQIIYNMPMYVQCLEKHLTASSTHLSGVSFGAAQSCPDWWSPCRPLSSRIHVHVSALLVGLGWP